MDGNCVSFTKIMIFTAYMLGAMQMMTKARSSPDGRHRSGELFQAPGTFPHSNTKKLSTTPIASGKFLGIVCNNIAARAQYHTLHPSI
jgi:hypothetical protein